MSSFFGRPGGPARAMLSVVMIGVLGLLGFVFIHLNDRLANQEAANQESIERSSAIVEVNDSVSARLAQLTGLVDSADTALQQTEALDTLLIDLREAVEPAAAVLSGTSESTQLTNQQLATIQDVLIDVEGRVSPLVTSAQAFGDQGEQLQTILAGLISDLEASIASARSIKNAIPLP